ncbi:MAG: cytochrome c oxidase subunit II [Sphingomonadaceae bacterium]
MNQLLKAIAAAALLAAAPAAGAAPVQALPEQPPAELGELPPDPADISRPPITTPGEEVPLTEVAEDAAPTAALPESGVGMPDGRMGLQDQYTDFGESLATFHNSLLLPIIGAISLFVLGLMVWVIVRYRRRANPEPSRTTHNTTIEVVWTLVPVLILVVIAVPSLSLLARQYSPPAADITVKAVGSQWYWTYQYPDHGDFEIVSNVLSDEEAEARGEPRLLGVDERMVVPAGAVVKVIVTSTDVVHSFGIPAFWVKIDAIPGHLNETWFKVERPGVYYGQCYELCGARHAYMPIAVEAMEPARFAQWVAAKGGAMPGQEEVEEEPRADATETPIGEAAEAPVETDTVPVTREAGTRRDRAVEN